MGKCDASRASRLPGGLDCGKKKCPGDEGYVGADCQFKPCPGAEKGQACSGHGKCEAGACKCDRTFKGEACDLPACPDDCNNNGACMDGVCTCNKGFTGNACEKKS